MERERMREMERMRHRESKQRGGRERSCELTEAGRLLAVTSVPRDHQNEKRQQLTRMASYATLSPCFLLFGSELSQQEPPHRTTNP